MKCFITNMTMSTRHQPLDIFSDRLADNTVGPIEIEATVKMIGSPEEAHGLTAYSRELEIRPADRFEKEDKKRETFDNIKKGDEVRYQFIRGAQGYGPEESQWMKVIAVNGDMITAVFSQEKFQNKYEFRVLRCQIIEHKPKAGRKMKVTAQERIDVPTMGDTIAAPDSTVRIKEGYKLVKDEENGSIAALRKQVEEFNLE